MKINYYAVCSKFLGDNLERINSFIHIFEQLKRQYCEGESVVFSLMYSRMNDG